MMFLILLPVYFIVILIAFFIAKAIRKKRKKAGKSSWKIITAMAVITFFIVTWDWVPSEIYYAYQCNQLEPIKFYKTPEQWIKENQDLIQEDAKRKAALKGAPDPVLKWITKDRIQYGIDKGFKIKTEQDLPQVSKEGYPLSYAFIDRWFVEVGYRNKNKDQRVLRTYHSINQIVDRRTGEILMEEYSVGQVFRFYSPPETSGSKLCVYSWEDSQKYRELEKRFYKINDGLLY